MKMLVKTVLLLTVLTSAALVTGALHSGKAKAAPGSVCVTASFFDPATGLISCVDQFGNVVPVATVQPVSPCRVGPGGVIFCPPGTNFTFLPQVVFLQPGQQFFFFNPFQSLLFRNCFMTVFGTLACF